MVEMIRVKVAQGTSISLRSECLCERSQYFRAVLKGDLCDIQEEIEIPWSSDPALCELFLFWLSQVDLPQEFPFNRPFQLLKCCSYFQVTREYWESVQKHAFLPEKYSQMSEKDKKIWVRQVIPVDVAIEMVSKVGNKLERLVYMLAWLNENTATSVNEKRDLTHCDDFYALQDWVVTSFPSLQSQRVLTVFGQPLVLFGTGSTSQQSTTVVAKLAVYREVLTRLKDFPVAANCMETVWLLQMIESGALTV